MRCCVLGSQGDGKQRIRKLLWFTPQRQARILHRRRNDEEAEHWPVMEQADFVERTISSMQPGEHACCILADDARYRDVFARFAGGGLAAGEEILYLYHASSPEMLAASLSQAGVDAQPALTSGQLAFLPCEAVFGRPDRFDPNAALAALKAVEEQALAGGYPALRAVVEMSWAAGFLPGTPEAARLAEYESSLNRAGAFPRTMLLCIYDRRALAPGVLLEILSTHPQAADGPLLFQNTRYLPPDASLSRQRDEARLDRQLQDLFKQQKQPSNGSLQGQKGWGKRPRKEIKTLAGAQAALVESESRYKAIFDHATDAIFIHDLDGHILEVNSVACQRLGYTASELLGKTPAFVDAPELAGQFPVRINLLMRYGMLSFETVHINRQGEMIPVEVNARLIEYDGRTAVLSIARDITDRKRAEIAQLNANQALAAANEALEAANGALAEANAALRESEQKFRSLVESSPDGVFLADETGRIIEFNPANETIYGIPAAQVMGRTLADFYYASQPPELRLEYRYAGIERSISEGLKTGRAEWLGRINEREISRPDGHRRFIQSIGFPIHTDRGYMIGVITRDVTDHRLAELELEQYRQRLETMVAERTAQLQHEIHERRQAEENLQVMLREIHHRVKNNLNVIIALIDMQKSAIGDPLVLQVFKELQTRAYSMALVHESLYRSPNLAQVDFSGYLRTLVAYLNTAYGSGGSAYGSGASAPAATAAAAVPVRLLVESEKISLKIESAIPCGLIVNELVTNALKYAFPPGNSFPDGEITVGLSCRQAGEERRFVLTVRDNGVGMLPGVDWRAASTLGLQLVQVLTRQLGGSITLDTGSGTAWRLEFSERRL